MPWPVHPNGLLGGSGSDNDTYQISRSLRFNSADTAYLSRTPASAGNRKTWTFSAWIKLGSTNPTIATPLGTIFSGSNGGPSLFNSSGLRICHANDPTGTDSVRMTSAIVRDPSAWYHVVWWCDTTQVGTRWKIYINGIEQTLETPSGYNGEPAQNTDLSINSTAQHLIGQYAGSYFDGYLTEINFIDGQALTPSSFGETDTITGRWKAKAYSGTYGTNGFYLKFADNSGTTSTTLGKDSSLNGNNWTPNNFSVTVGAGNDSLVDSPTNYGADSYNITVDNSRGNYNTFNPLSNVTTATLTNGNLDAGASAIAIGSIGMSSGKWYWEITSTGGATAVGMYGVSATSTRSVAAGVTEGFRFDSVAGTLDYTVNGSTFTSIATGLTSIPYFIYVSTAAATTASLNCGQRLFSYTMPSGYKALCTTNLTTPIIKKPGSYFDALIYTGTGASNSISSLGFSPDLVWIKSRGGATSHAIYDTSRGVQAQLSSDTTGAEVTSSTGLTAFGSNGFTIGTSTLVNTSGTQYVAWAWDEAPISGFDIVSYQGDGSAGRNISHNLGVVPKFIIVKNRVTAGFDFVVYHASMNATPQNGYMALNGTLGYSVNSTIWNNTAPTSSVFTVGTNTALNKTGENHIAYLWAEVEGFSKIGSYVGNSSADGIFVWCGFRPRYILFKNPSGGTYWQIYDAARNTYNVVNSDLYAGNAASEQADASLDILSNGFKARSITYINDATINFVAFAESPFKYARAR